MRIILKIIILIGIVNLIFTSCDKSDRAKTTVSKEELVAFEKKVYETRHILLHEHTYDKDNLPIADSIYSESERIGSDYGKMVALQIKYYVYIADTAQGANFIKTIDEFLDIVQKNNDPEDYYDALNAKLYYYIEKEKFYEAKDMVTKALAEAEKSNDHNGLYFANYMMSNIYQNRGNYAIAIPYLKKAVTYANGDSLRISLVNRELSFAYANCEDYKLALETAEIGRRIAPTLVYKIWAEHQYLITLFATNEKKRFLEEWDKSVIKDTDTEGVLPDYMLTQLKSALATCHEDWEQAIEYANQIEHETVRLNDLLTIYVTKQDYKKAYEIRSQIDEMKDSIQTNLQIADLAEMDTRLGNSQLKMKADKLHYTNQRNIFICIIIILVIIFVFGAWITYKDRKHLAILNQKNEELQKANELAEKSSNVKSIFLSNITHELRTPLNHICGFAQVLADRDMPIDEDSTRNMADIIVDSSLHLTNVLDNIVKVTDRLEHLNNLEEVESTLSATDYTVHSLQESKEPQTD